MLRRNVGRIFADKTKPSSHTKQHSTWSILRIFANAPKVSLRKCLFDATVTSWMTVPFEFSQWNQTYHPSCYSGCFSKKNWAITEILQNCVLISLCDTIEKPEPLDSGTHLSNHPKSLNNEKVLLLLSLIWNADHTLAESCHFI